MVIKLYGGAGFNVGAFETAAIEMNWCCVGMALLQELLPHYGNAHLARCSGMHGLTHQEMLRYLY
ncbi:hypothetical protein KCP69_21895 [Salmonella enterica subsp. enterica]|nr:hypothetical protein KCP69_21895 [Salmonella enterica subsp. enterica]